MMRIPTDHDGWHTAIVCQFHQAHSTPKWGWTDFVTPDFES